ncbi:hypothetical protein GA0070609_3346 [Micromonospora echinaurantiaca]|uniref:Uncharacterized protein n=1 Tax=Micromonospora echinaurantiaca TaxID=47857 RepID=A0A1C5IH42_9ACTN|nr:hypothetical protein [Micromonospora echinaurantiaca]SCG57732.1 hypothetical protein GA0070609_3346 [Micromonospora echinaurantiaca]
MNDYRKTFEEYVADSPRTSINIDDLVTRGRRSQLRRRLAVSSGALGLLAVAVLLGVSALKPSAGPPLPPAANSSASIVASESAASADPADRLLTALKSAFAREAPNVSGFDTLQRQMHKCNPDNPAVSQLVPYDAARLDEACPPDSLHRKGEYYAWRGTLTSPTGVYNVRLTIARTTHYDPATPPEDETGANERRIAAEQGDSPRRGPNGENILAKPYLLNMSKPDGTGIFIACEDKNGGPGAGERSPFTADQLTAVGLDPALHL